MGLVMVSVKVPSEVRDAWKLAAGEIGVSAWLRQLAEVELDSTGVSSGPVPVVKMVDVTDPVVSASESFVKESVVAQLAEMPGVTTARKLPESWHPTRPKVRFDG